MITAGERAIGKLIERHEQALREFTKGLRAMCALASKDVDNDELFGDNLAKIFDGAAEAQEMKEEIAGLKIALAAAEGDRDRPLAAIQDEIDRELHRVEEMEKERLKLMEKVFWETNSDPAQARTDYGSAVGIEEAEEWEMAKIRGKQAAKAAAAAVTPP